ncbi:hypothetical protein FRC10_003204 [Ceratobasidium sp. 414]|nr:hypothetical protein FRC10_003204 [Ceratobasidium sp. 414]
MHSLFTNVDLLHHVTLESDPKDWPSLARISRSFFSFAAPFIWRKVEGVHNILALSPRVEIQLSGTSPKWVKRMEIRDRGSRDPTRFDIYAPFVRSLEIYGKGSGEYDVTNWKALAQYARDILPNLVQLTLTAPFSITGRHQLFWIRTFLSPSLLDIHVVGEPTGELPLVHPRVALSLLKHISELAPMTQRLSVYIEDEDEVRLDEDSEMIVFWEPQLQSCFKNLRSLRELTSTAAVITPEMLPIVASLAYLEVLNIQLPCDGSMGVWKTVDPKSLPANPFPALKHFSLCGADAGEAWIVLDYSAFPNVPSLRLELDHYPTPDELGPGTTQPPWEYQLIKLIVRTCPHLTNLDINFDESDHSPCNLRSPSNGWNALLLMSKFPLQTVCISSAAFGLIGDSDVVTRDELRVAWPHVTRLSMPHLEAHFNLLYGFSQLPNLQELTLRLYLECDSIDDSFFERPTGSLSLRMLRGSACMFLVEAEAKEAARALHHCWPNLEGVEVDPAGGDEDYGEDHEALLAEQLDEVNREIELLQESRSDSTGDLP